MAFARGREGGKSDDEMVVSEFQLKAVSQQRRTIKMPWHVVDPGRNQEISPDGAHIAWIAREYRVSPFEKMFHRYLPSIQIHGELIDAIWVSDIDGKHQHQIGCTRLIPHNDGVSQVSWIPDQKHVSFTYAGSLYTVPVK